MSKKKIKIKVKKRKLKIKRILICLLSLILLVLISYVFSKLPIRNIYIVGNNMLSDKEVIELAGISDYPSFLTTFSDDIENKIESNIYVKDVVVKKRFYNKLYIYVTEKKVLCLYDDKLLLEDGNYTSDSFEYYNYPILLSDIIDIKDRFTSEFSLVNEDILLKISEIEYVPNDVDSERFSLKMNDGNLVYITLTKIEKINKYNSIYSSLDGKKGIIYLDSGDYVEVKEE